MTSDTTQQSQERATVDDREPTIVLQDAGYALAGLTDEAVGLVRDLPSRLESLREETPDRLRDLRTEAPDRIRTVQGNAKSALHNQREHYEARLRDLREAANDRLETRRQRLEAEFDRHAERGREVTDELRADERYAQVEDQLQRVLTQTRSTRSQFKAAFTSVRRTADAAVEAGREQAVRARSQVKAAATSARKSARTVVDAGQELAG